jgi:ketosteroid isomerase-like protein
MAGSRAASAREPGQIREEAALSVTARAPRTSLAGAEDRRARPRTCFEAGCTVHALVVSNIDVIKELTRLWNEGDTEAVLRLYAGDAVTQTGPHWPEQATYRGHDEIRASMDEWQAMWETTSVVVDELEEVGADQVIAVGAWRMRGRASGIDGEMPIFILFTVRDGKVARLEWHSDRDSAKAAAVEAHG